MQRGFSPQPQALRAALSIHGFQGVVGILLHRPFQGFGKKGEPIQLEVGRCHLPVSAQEPQGYERQRLSALVIGHVDASAQGILPHRHRQGELRIGALGHVLTAFGLHQIFSVRKLGKVHAHGILGVITFVKIDHFPGLEGFLSLAQRKVGMVEIAENHLRAALFHPHVQILAFQLLQKVLHPRAGLGQGGLLARKVLPDPFKALAGLGQGLVLLAAGLPQIQFFLVHQQPVGLREKGQCLAGILASEGLEGLPFEGKFLPGERFPAQHPVFQRAVGWISAIQLFLKDLVDFFLLGAGVPAGLQEVP